MALEFPWRHDEGYISPHAHLVITEIVIKAISGEVRISYSIWENSLAFKVGGEVLHQDTVPFHLSLFPEFVDRGYGLLRDYLTAKYNTDVIKEDVNE